MNENSVPFRTPQRPERFALREFVLLLTWACVVSCAVLAPIALADGWPQNHEGVAAVHRLTAVVGQWRAGHVLPVWSSVSHEGMGSPMPGLYHKTFMLMSAAIYAATGGVKVAVVGALLLCSVVGFMGVAWATVVAYGRACWPAGVVAGTLLLTSNYATTDWLIRGAFAEYSAVAAIGAIMVPLMRLVCFGVWSRWIGPLVAFAMLSHMALALLVPLLFVIGLVAAATTHPLDWPRLMRQVSVSALLALALALPLLMPVIAFSGYNDTSELLSEGLRPGSNFIDPINYVWDRSWTWGDGFSGFTVQFDLYVFPVVMAAVALLLCNWAPVRSSIRDARPPVAGGPRSAIPLRFLLCVFFFYLVLQMRLAAPVYELVPGARYLQFPWRLQAYTTVASVMLVAALIVHLWRQPGEFGRWCALMLSMLSVFVSLNSSPAVSGMRYPSIPDMRVFGAGETDYLAGGEFGPRPPPGTELPRYAHLASQFALSSVGECAVERLDWHRFVEASELGFRVECPRAGDARFPVFLAPGMRARGDDGTDLSMYRTCTDARVRLDLPAGSHSVVIGLPGWWSLLVSELKAEPRRTRDYC